MTVLSYGQIVGLAVGAGFSAPTALVMAAIAEAESSGKTDAVNHNTNGTEDVGVWQINDVNSGVIRAAGGDRTNPQQNAAMAYAIYKGQGLHAWSTYNSGAYRKFLKGSATPVPLGPAQAGTGSNGTAESTEQTSVSSDLGLGGVTSALGSVDKLAGDLTDPNLWKRAGLFLLGITALLLGFYLWQRKSIDSAASSVASVAKVAAL